MDLMTRTPSAEKLVSVHGGRARAMLVDLSCHHPGCQATSEAVWEAPPRPARSASGAGPSRLWVHASDAGPWPASTMQELSGSLCSATPQSGRTSGWRVSATTRRTRRAPVCSWSPLHPRPYLATMLAGSTWRAADCRAKPWTSSPTFSHQDAYSACCTELSARGWRLTGVLFRRLSMRRPRSRTQMMRQLPPETRCLGHSRARGNSNGRRNSIRSSCGACARVCARSPA
mmetsp:Transcript_115031/g.336439  ORF Transcript_115031/g.336439 Transcript_115031/m.336439 type:complete len:230 (-) Transcript_115031:748-1437(-)